MNTPENTKDMLDSTLVNNTLIKEESIEEKELMPENKYVALITNQCIENARSTKAFSEKMFDNLQIERMEKPLEEMFDSLASHIIDAIAA
ncbi:MAG: hypothetical protein LKG27_02215 [Clostridiaceae bacterium]|jgi:hypothetical protein|nr:hypothetical protein [Clostridiaceae bacterium]